MEGRKTIILSTEAQQAGINTRMKQKQKSNK
jgi:hypothetical protein